MVPWSQTQLNASTFKIQVGIRVQSDTAEAELTQAHSWFKWESWYHGTGVKSNPAKRKHIQNSSGNPCYRPTIRTGYVGLNVLDMEITNMFQSKNLSTRTRPRKVVTATTYFPVVATPGGWDLAKLRADLGSYHDSKTFGLFSLARSHQNFRVLKCTMAQAPSTYNRPIRCVWLYGTRNHTWILNVLAFS